MSSSHRAVLFGFFVALIVAICGAAYLKGGLYLGKHEGDTFHLLQIIFRMADGQWPHLDFVTPIGAFAFWPFVWFVNDGFGVGTSIILGQTAMAIILLPAIWWVATTRFSWPVGALFGAIIIIMIAALVHGEAERSVSISMHYNRWAWALSFIAIASAMIPPNRENQIIDGILIGAVMFALAMIKITYFGAFAVPIVVALCVHRAFRVLSVAFIVGLALALIVSLFAGFGFWQAYLGNLLAVALSDIRPFPSEPLGAVMGAPAYLGASLILLLSIIFLRQARQLKAGLILFLLAPGFFYVTYQNHGNDPQWLLILVVILLAHIPPSNTRNGLGWDMRVATTVMAAAAFATTAPSFFNLAYSSFRHINIAEESYEPYFAKSAIHNDLFSPRLRAFRTDQRGPLDISGTSLTQYATIEEAIEQTTFRGEDLPICSLELGMIAWFQAIVDDLELAGLSGPDTSIFAADLFSSHWLFGDFSPLQGGAPWYYGGLPGIKNADYLIVPQCPVIHEVRGSILADIEARKIELTEIRRNKLFTLYSIDNVPPNVATQE